MLGTQPHVRSVRFLLTEAHGPFAQVAHVDHLYAVDVRLVRRLRRVLFKAGIVNLIESRYGAGYRLVLRP